MVNPIPEGHHSLTPYLILKNAADAITFYKQAFNAQEIVRVDTPNGGVGHAELKIGNSMIMMADECAEMGFKNPLALGGTPVSICLYVNDVDNVFDRAIAAGATPLKPVEDQFYGDRSGMLTDPFGHVWCIATHIKDVTPEEIAAYCATMEK